MASFGSDTEEIFTRTNSVLNSIFASASVLGTYYWTKQVPVSMKPDEHEDYLKEKRKAKRIFWEIRSEKDEDEVNRNLADILALLERETEPVFKEKGAFDHIITWLKSIRADKSNAANAKKQDG